MRSTMLIGAAAAIAFVGAPVLAQTSSNPGKGDDGPGHTRTDPDGTGDLVNPTYGGGHPTAPSSTPTKKRVHHHASKSARASSSDAGSSGATGSAGAASGASASPPH